jgi:SAM-dependent methyltransferase
MMPREGVMPDQYDWSSISNVVSGGLRPSLSLMDIPDGDPDVENQIGQAEDEHSVAFFKQFHLPMILRAGIAPEECRILELGAGFGRLAYGTLKTISPKTYVATDVFPQLVDILAENLSKWTSGATGAALFDPQSESFIKKGAFNVIQSHSVLHHVLDYRGAVASLYETLASPGLIIFTEPCLESYQYFITLYNLFENSESVPEDVRLEMSYLRVYIYKRGGEDREDIDFLRSCGAGDKHLYSAYDLHTLADSLGSKLFIIKDNRKPLNNFLFELSLRKADAELLKKFEQFLIKNLPEGISNAYFSDLRQVFCFIKS